jgi:hypothetical protein
VKVRIQWEYDAAMLSGGAALIWRMPLPFLFEKECAAQKRRLLGRIFLSDVAPDTPC